MIPNKDGIMKIEQFPEVQTWLKTVSPITAKGYLKKGVTYVKRIGSG